MVERDSPDAWKGEIEAASVEVLPLVDGPEKNRPSGWCTYTYGYDECPDLEVFCGGINSKTPKAGALWRQGNLLHFGFEESPAELNENGRAMLVNSIVYIAKFTEDRPISQTPSPFAGPAPRSRESISRLLNDKDLSIPLMQYLGFYLSPETMKGLEGKDQQQIEAWYSEVKPFIHADSKGKLTVDEEARSFGVSPASAEFFEKAIDVLDKDDAGAAIARQLLGRYAAIGPANDESAEAWRDWWTKNKDYLFFSDAGWYRWYIDPLAKKRGVPTAEIRGPLRATLQ